MSSQSPQSPQNPPGHTRSTRQLTHLLHTPDAWVRTPLPGLTDGLAIIHAAPVLGARFLQYTAELTPGGTLAPGEHQRFVYILEGTGTLDFDRTRALDRTRELDRAREEATAGAFDAHPLHPGSFAYLPPGHGAGITAASALRLAVIEKRYHPLPGVGAAPFLCGHADDIAAHPLNGDTDLLVRSLLPAEFAFDFAVNTMHYASGAALAQVEVHAMEHGLVMLTGTGTYRLGDLFYPVERGDFIWMAPFCPQWFAAHGPGPASYLIYKDWNRVPAL